MRLRRQIAAVVLAAVAAGAATATMAASVTAAVAANFTEVAIELVARFQAKTGNEVRLSFGSTGALYTQITQAAPFDVFLAADRRRPAAAIDAGYAVAGSAFTYAIGKLVLYSPTIDVSDGAAVLTAGGFHHIAVADPKTAPYGAAGMAVLDALGLTDAVASKIVTGENITQTLQFVRSGSAELGFVALSQVAGAPATQLWLPPEEDYPAIRQDAVLLRHGADNAAAKAFLAFLRSDEAEAAIEAAGYVVE